MLLNQLKEDLKTLNARKDQVYNAYYQVIGAVDIIQQLIFRLEKPDSEKIDDKLFDELKLNDDETNKAINIDC